MFNNPVQLTLLNNSVNINFINIFVLQQKSNEIHNKFIEIKEKFRKINHSLDRNIPQQDDIIVNLVEDILVRSETLQDIFKQQIGVYYHWNIPNGSRYNNYHYNKSNYDKSNYDWLNPYYNSHCNNSHYITGDVNLIIGLIELSILIINENIGDSITQKKLLNIAKELFNMLYPDYIFNEDKINFLINLYFWLMDNRILEYLKNDPVSGIFWSKDNYDYTRKFRPSDEILKKFYDKNKDEIYRIMICDLHPINSSIEPKIEPKNILLDSVIYTYLDIKEKLSKADKLLECQYFLTK